MDFDSIVFSPRRQDSDDDDDDNNDYYNNNNNNIKKIPIYRSNNKKRKRNNNNDDNNEIDNDNYDDISPPSPSSSSDFESNNNHHNHNNNRNNNNNNRNDDNNEFMDMEQLDELAQQGFNRMANVAMIGQDEQPIITYEPELLPKHRNEAVKRRLREEAMRMPEIDDEDDCPRCEAPTQYDDDDESIYSDALRIILQMEKKLIKKGEPIKDIANCVSRKYNKLIYKRSNNGVRKWSVPMLERCYLNHKQNDIQFKLNRHIQILDDIAHEIIGSGICRKKHINGQPVGNTELDGSKLNNYFRTLKVMETFSKLKLTYESDKQKMKIMKTKDSTLNKASSTIGNGGGGGGGNKTNMSNPNKGTFKQY